MACPGAVRLAADLLAALPASHAAAVRDAIACATAGCPASVSAGFMPLLLDTVLFLLKTGVFSTAASLASRYVAAYVVYVGAMLARETVDPSRLEALRLPGDSNMAHASPFCAMDWGSDDKVWMQPDPLLFVCHLSPPPPRPGPPVRARGQSPLRMARSTTSPLFSCPLTASRRAATPFTGP